MKEGVFLNKYDMVSVNRRNTAEKKRRFNIGFFSFVFTFLIIFLLIAGGKIASDLSKTDCKDEKNTDFVFKKTGNLKYPSEIIPTDILMKRLY